MNEKIELSEDAKRARREYHRRWQKEHPEKVALNQARYWARCAAKVEKDNGNEVNDTWNPS